VTIFWCCIFQISEPLNRSKARLGSHGYYPENPFWQEKSLTTADPDGWRVVLVNTEGS